MLLTRKITLNLHHFHHQIPTNVLLTKAKLSSPNARRKKKIRAKTYAEA
jgi:hypothetical protein